MLGSVRACRRRLAADNRGRLVDQSVILQGVDHEEREVDAARAVAREHGVSHVPAPHRQALALALFEVAAADDRPAGVAGEDPSARFDLIVEVGEAEQSREPANTLTNALSFQE